MMSLLGPERRELQSPWETWQSDSQGGWAHIVSLGGYIPVSALRELCHTWSCLANLERWAHRGRIHNHAPQHHKTSCLPDVHSASINYWQGHVLKLCVYQQEQRWQIFAVQTLFGMLL